MRSSIRIKFTVGLTVILLIMGIALNLLIRQVFENNLENAIRVSMKDIMNNSREYINYRMIYKRLPFNRQGLTIEAGEISDYFMATYSSQSQVLDMDGSVLEYDSSLKTSNSVDKAVETAKEGKAVINISYSKKDVNGMLSFPLFYNDQYIGIIIINKSYSDLYNYNTMAINFITIIELSVFFLIFIISFVYLSYIIKPLKNLTDALKSFGEGNYDVKLIVKSKDEIGRLSSEFMNMKLSIKKQIGIINSEKEKTLRLERERKEFFNNVTHELKTPLTAISGYAQMLLDKKLEDPQFKERAIQRIYMESERMHELVLDLINVSKGVSFEDEEKKLIDMSKLINEICDDMEIKAEKYFLSFNRHISTGFILGQNNKIRQLVINILDNAIKYSLRDEQILIETFSEDKFFVLQVTNKGEMIPQEVYNNIFEPFIRGIKTEESSSRGLGLYICSEIVKEHNGYIHIENGEVIRVIVKIPSSGNTLETT